MSTTIDSKVVEMQFDNRHFETNVSTTMSTLDKLKQKLRLDGASKGLEEINNASRKVDFSGLNNSIDTVGLKFNGLYTIADQALRNITTSAMNAGKQLLKSLSIDQITAGWDKYDQKTASVQTIMNATGLSIDEVNDRLDKLMWFSDETSYSFTDMTAGLATMVSSGGDIEKLIPLLMGVANATAFAGKGAAEFSRVLQYGVNQAYSLGYMQVQDWKTIEGATVNSKQLMETLIASAEELGKIEKGSITLSKFRESLRDGWLDKDVMEHGFGRFAEMTEKAFQMVNSGEVETASEAYALLSEQYDNVYLTAAKAAQEAKTFTEAIEATKDAVSSGWLRTFEIIFGNYQEAKELWTDLANTLWDVFASGAEVRNWVIETALRFAEPWEALSEKLAKITNFTNDIKDAVDMLEYYQTVVNKVWRGDYNNRGDNPDRRDLLTAEGYNYRVVQDLVNKGYQYKLTVDDINETHKKYGITVKENTEASSDLISMIEAMSDEELKNAGLTEDEIDLLRALAKEAKRTGKTIQELGDEMANKQGRDLLIDGLKNIGTTLLDLVQISKDAFAEIFNPPSAGETVVRLYSIVSAFNKFTEKIRLTDKETGELTETAKKLQRILKGVFAILDIITTILGGGLKIALKIVSGLLDVFGMSILDVIAFVADGVVAFRNLFKSIFDISGLIKKIGPAIKTAAEAIGDWFSRFKESDGIKDAIDYIKELYTSVKEWFSGLKDAEDLPKTIAEGIVEFFSSIPKVVSTVFSNLWKAIAGSFGEFEDTPIGGFLGKIGDGLKLAGQVIVEIGKILLEKINGFLSEHGFATISEDSIAGLVNGFKDGAAKVWDAAIQMASTLVTKVKDFFGIASPSKVFFAIGGFIIAGLIAGLQNGIPNSLGAIKDVFQPMLDWINGIDWGAVFSAVMSTGILVVMYKFADALSVLSGLGDMLEEIGDSIKHFFKGIKYFGKAANNAAKGIKYQAMSKMILSIAIAIGVLAASVFLLSLVDPGKMWGAVGAMAALMVVLGALMISMQVFSSKLNVSSIKEFVLIGVMVGTIAASLLLLAIALRVVAGIGDMTTLVTSVFAMVVLIAGIIKSIDLLQKDATSASATILKIAAAMLLLAVVAKILSGMSWDELGRAGAGLLGMTIIVAALIYVTKFARKNIEKVGPTLLKISAAILILTIVAKIIAGMSWGEIGKAAVGITGLTVIIFLLIKCLNKYQPAYLAKVGSTLLAMAGAMAILAIVAKLIASMSWGEIGKAAVGITGLTVIIFLLIKCLNKYSPTDLTKVASTLIAMAVAIGILGLVVTLLGFLSIEHLAKGIIAVGLLSGIMALMIMATKDAKDCYKNIYAMSIAIGVMALAIIALSFIKPEKLAGATIAMAIVMGMFALILKAGSNINSSIWTLIVMTAAIAVIAVVIASLAQLPVESVIGSAVALSVLLMAMSAALVIISNVGKTVNIKDLGVGILGLAAVIVAIYAVVDALAKMDGLQNAQTNALALGALMAVLSVVTVIIAAAGAIIGATGAMGLLGIVALLGVVVALYPVVDVLGKMEGLQNAEKNAIILGGFMTVLSVLAVIISVVGIIVAATYGLALLGLVALLGIVGALWGVVEVLRIMEGLQNAQANVDLLIVLMNEITKMAVILAIVGPLALIGTVAVAALLSLVVAFGALAVGIGALMEKFPQLEAFLDTGIVVLEKLAFAIGSFVGNLVSGFLGSVAGSLPGLGTALSEFMINATPFIEGAKLIDASVLAGVGILAGAVIALTAADLIAGIASFLSGGSSFADLGTELSKFMINALPFIVYSKLLDSKAVEGVKGLVDIILSLTSANILDGLTSWFTGGTSLSKFGEEIASFGPYMKQYADSVAGIDGDSVRASADAAKALSEMASNMPNSGGVMGWFFGENDMDVFGEQLVTLGTSLCEYAKSVENLNVDPILASVDATKAVSEAAANLPNSGGVAGFFAGENDMDVFGTQLVTLGTSLCEYSKSVENLNVDPILTSVDATKAISEVAANLPNSGGVAAFFSGDNDMTTFGTQLEAFGTSMVNYSNSVSDLKMEPINDSISAVKALSDITGTMSNSGGIVSWWTGDNDLKTFGNNLVDFGKSMKKYSKEIAGIETTKMSGVISEVGRLVALSKNLTGDNATGLKTFGDSLKSIGKSSVNKFIKAFEDAGTDAYKAMKKVIDKIIKALEDNHPKIKEAGGTFMKKFTSGISDTESTTTKTVKTFLSGLVTAIRDKFSDFKSAGSYLVTGFANGIDENDFKAAAKARAMAKSAARAAEEELKIKSPSRVFYGIGKFAGIGFVNALGDYADKADKAGSELARSSVDGLNYAISKVADFVNSDIDAQPTIRPVLDLSDVRSGVGAIGGMLSGRRTLLVDTQSAGTISASMAQRQNGVSTDELVSTIKGLRKDIANMPRNNYNINGITYDDGSNISEAVQTLVRAAKMERRT